MIICLFRIRTDDDCKMKTYFQLLFSPSRRIKLIFYLPLAKKKKKIHLLILFLYSKTECQEYLLSTHTKKSACIDWWSCPLKIKLHQFSDINTCPTLMIRKHLVDTWQVRPLMVNTLFGLASFSCMQLDS